MAINPASRLLRSLNVTPGQTLVIKVGTDEFKATVPENKHKIIVEVIDGDVPGRSKPTGGNPATDGMKTR